MLRGIYQIIAGGRRYLGSSEDIARRWREHLEFLRKGTHSNHRLQAAWAKHGATFEVLELVEGDLAVAEQNWLDRTANDLNIALFVGANMRGRKHSESARAKMSASRIGLRPGPATRAKLSIAHKGNRSRTGQKRSAAEVAKSAAAQVGNQHAKGRKHSTEVRALISASHKGKPKSAEHRAKLAEILKKARASK